MICLTWTEIGTYIDHVDRSPMLSSTNSTPMCGHKWNESGFRPPLCTYRLNWARRTSWGWWDDWDDTVLQTQDSKFDQCVVSCSYNCVGRLCKARAAAKHHLIWCMHVCGVWLTTLSCQNCQAEACVPTDTESQRWQWVVVWWHFKWVL